MLRLSFMSLQLGKRVLLVDEITPMFHRDILSHLISSQHPLAISPTHLDPSSTCITKSSNFNLPSFQPPKRKKRFPTSQQTDQSCSTRPSVHLSICPSVHLSICPSTRSIQNVSHLNIQLERRNNRLIPNDLIKQIE